MQMNVKQASLNGFQSEGIQLRGKRNRPTELTKVAQFLQYICKSES